MPTGNSVEISLPSGKTLAEMILYFQDLEKLYGAAARFEITMRHVSYDQYDHGYDEAVYSVHLGKK